MKKIIIIIAMVIMTIAGTIATQIKDINTTEYGTQITFKDNTGFWFEK